MASRNKPTATTVKSKPTPKTHNGARADVETPFQQLERSTMTCLLWENTYYEQGESISDRIAKLIRQVEPDQVRALALKAKNEMYLRHVPLFMAIELVKARHEAEKAPSNYIKLKKSEVLQLTLKHGVSQAEADRLTIDQLWEKIPIALVRSEINKVFPSSLVSSLVKDVVQRADELGEVISLYWGGKRKPLPKAIKTGLAEAFNKFDEYQFSKYKADDKSKKAISLRDVMFLVHPKPENDARAELYKRIAEKTLTTAQTWEAQLSKVGQENKDKVSFAKSKKEIFENQMSNNKLGGLATLKNLRGMLEVGVDTQLIKNYIANNSFKKVLPFRFLSAADHAPQLEKELYEAMVRCVKNVEKLPGKTLVLIDLSGSMDSKISSKGETKCSQVASAVGAIAEKVCENPVVFGYGTTLNRAMGSGFSLWKSLQKANMGGTNTGDCTKQALGYHPDATRVIIITDEQSSDILPKLESNQRGYIVNVAPYGTGMYTNNKSKGNEVKYEGNWTRINGWSEQIFRYIYAIEGINNENLSDDPSVETEEN